MKKNKYIFVLLTFLISLGLILAFTRGYVGSSVFFQNDYNTQIGGPFEASNSTSRYALTEAISKYKTFIFNNDEAKFSSPDVSEYKGNFFSTFTPGVSFIGVPFYLIGNVFGLPQIFTYFSVIIFSVFNLFLVAKLSRRLGANLYASILSGFIFLFATNSLSYSLTFTQHPMSVSFIILSLLNVLHKRTIKNNILLGIYVGLGLLIDIPNIIILIPVIFYVFYSHFDIKKIGNKINFNFKAIGIFFFIGIIPLIVLFGTYNLKTTGSFTKIGQTIGRSDYFKFQSPNLNNLPSTIVNETQNKNYLIDVPFQTRNQINGFYTLLLSNERSWLYYSPIILLGILGLILAYRNPKRSTAAKLGAAVLFFNIVTYSMFGDPWGGWSFGPRYLIPGAAIMTAGIGVAILKWKKKPIFFITFLLLFSYSVYVSTLGALTTNSIAPKVEAEQLKPAIPYTYKYNLGFINNNKSGNLLYNSWLNNYISLRNFWYLSIVIIMIISMFGCLLVLREREEGNV